LQWEDSLQANPTVSEKPNVSAAPSMAVKRIGFGVKCHRCFSLPCVRFDNEDQDTAHSNLSFAHWAVREKETKIFCNKQRLLIQWSRVVRVSLGQECGMRKESYGNELVYTAP
jgi:hypothetical protein